MVGRDAPNAVVEQKPTLDNDRTNHNGISRTNTHKLLQKNLTNKVIDATARNPGANERESERS